MLQVTPSRILVVDDDPDVVDYLTPLLEDNGYEVRSAIDAEAARLTLQSYRPDVILIDVLMPGRSGMDLLIALRTNDRDRDLPIVLVTGCDDILEDNCRSYLGTTHGIRGPDHIVPKPVDPQLLLDVVRGLVYEKAQISGSIRDGGRDEPQDPDHR